MLPVPQYMKAYTLGQLRRFPGWKEPSERHSTAPDSADATVVARLGDAAIVYLCEDLRVIQCGLDRQDVLFDAVTAEWEVFCRQTLVFRVPDWETESQEVRRRLADLREEDGAD